MKAVKDAEGAEIVSAPTVTTLSGRQAQIQTVDIHQTPSGEKYSTGPVIDFIPTISPDGQSVQMVIAAQLSYLMQNPSRK